MEEAAVSPVLSEALNFLSLGLSVVLLFAMAYLWSSNNSKTAELEKLKADVQRMKKSLNKLQEKVDLFREPKIVSDVPQAEPFGLDLFEARPTRVTPLAPQAPWIGFIDDYNKLAEEAKKSGQLMRCEGFVRKHKLRILTYNGGLAFQPAIDVEDSNYWAFNCGADEYAFVPNPMIPCDANLYEHGGMKEIFALNYVNGVYRKYFVKFPALFDLKSNNEWRLKSSGVVNLERN